MLDLVIRGGTVVTPNSVGEWDVGIIGEQIVTVSEKNTLTRDIGREIDARGKIIIPGGVEPHAHVAAPIVFQPGNLETAPPEQVSKAALFGGTTTIVDFALCNPGSDIPIAVEERNSRWKGKSYVDYSYHITIMGEPTLRVIDQIKESIAEGFPTIKIFTTNIIPNPLAKARRMVGMGDISEIMEEVAIHNGLLFVHAEDDDIVNHMYRRLVREDRTNWKYLHLAHSNMSEDLSFRRIIRLTEWTGAAVYFVHVSAKQGISAIQEGRSKGLPIYGETLHNYIAFSNENYKEPDGMKYHTYPSLKSKEDQLALWDGLQGGGLTCVATDEYCTSYDLKTKGRTIFDVTGGHNGVETRVGITYNEGVVKRGMSLSRFVDITSSNAARILGMYPKKGAIAPGSDADLVILNPKLDRTLVKTDFHISDYSIWEGWPIKGWPSTTILRGKVMVEEGRLLGSLGDGQLTPRRISREVISRPVL